MRIKSPLWREYLGVNECLRSWKLQGNVHKNCNRRVKPAETCEVKSILQIVVALGLIWAYSRLFPVCLWLRCFDNPILRRWWCQPTSCLSMVCAKTVVKAGGGWINTDLPPAWCFHRHSYWALSVMLRKSKLVLEKKKKAACPLQARLPAGFCLSTRWGAGSGWLSLLGLIPRGKINATWRTLFLLRHLIHICSLLRLSVSPHGAFLTSSLSPTWLIAAYKRNNSCESEILLCSHCTS